MGEEAVASGRASQARLSIGPLIVGYRIMMYESNERDAAASRPGFSGCMR